ncbi:hypothetical protein L6R52_27900 [Myxococcota bacterium]|nr:hypothetical protein [Myxococcota bacterium]
MTDHTFVTITCRAVDAEALRALFDEPLDEPPAIHGGLATLTYYAAPGALWEARHDAAAQGFVFHGVVGASIEGDSGVFVAIDGELVEAPTDERGELICRLDRSAHPREEDLARARRYLAAEQRAAAQMKP